MSKIHIPEHVAQAIEKDKTPETKNPKRKKKTPLRLKELIPYVEQEQSFRSNSFRQINFRKNASTDWLEDTYSSI